MNRSTYVPIFKYVLIFIKYCEKYKIKIISVKYLKDISTYGTICFKKKKLQCINIPVLNIIM